MLEAAARALIGLYCNDQIKEIIEADWKDWLPEARAALEAGLAAMAQETPE
jgi:hypothetical protein